MKFDTRDKKPKLYHLAVLAALTLGGQLLLMSGHDVRFLRWASLGLIIFFSLSILALLDAGRLLGVQLTDSLLMTPAKSVTAFVGLASEEPQCN